MLLFCNPESEYSTILFIFSTSDRDLDCVLFLSIMKMQPWTCAGAHYHHNFLFSGSTYITYKGCFLGNFWFIEEKKIWRATEQNSNITSVLFSRKAFDQLCQAPWISQWMRHKYNPWEICIEPCSIKSEMQKFKEVLLAFLGVQVPVQ